MGKGTGFDGKRHDRCWGKARLILGKGTEVDGVWHGGLWVSRKPESCLVICVRWEKARSRWPGTAEIRRDSG